MSHQHNIADLPSVQDLPEAPSSVLPRRDSVPTVGVRPLSTDDAEKEHESIKGRKEGTGPDEADQRRDTDVQRSFYAKYRPYILAGFAILILGWWISATVLRATRRRWIVQTLFAWAFITFVLPDYSQYRPI
jgi:CNT family concentrative nucleoside transporter